MKIKRILALVCALLLVLALFSGCGGAGNTTPESATKAPEASKAPAASKAPEASSSPATAAPAADDGVFYHYAADNNPNVDANKMPTAAYDYELPLTNSDEVLTMWTTCWVNIAFGEEGYAESPFPTELENMTGVHVEYDLVSGESRRENFSVLLASNDLRDIMSGAASCYTGGNFKKAVLEEEYFINIYDYREYCPNYIWQITYDEKDTLTRAKTFPEKDLITSFYFLWDQGMIQMDYFIHGDWLAKFGMTNDDVKTFDQLHDALAACQSQIESCTYPMTYYSTLEMSGVNTWNAYDTFFCCTGLGQFYVKDGQVMHANMNDNDKALMTMANQWYNDGLIDPNWASYSNNQDLPGDAYTMYAYVKMSANGADEQNASCDPDSDVGWLPVTRPVLYEGQVLHLGGDLTRTHYGSAAISSTCANIPLALTWIDWRYSTEGATYCTWGVEGFTWEYDENGNRRYTKNFYASEITNMTTLATGYLANDLVDPAMEYRMDRYAFPGGEGAVYAVNYWSDYNYDGAYSWPADIVLDDEQQDIVNKYSNDIGTYLKENYISFIDNSRSLSEWDSYIEGLKVVGIDQVLEVYQEAYDAYMAKK